MEAEEQETRQQLQEGVKAILAITPATFGDDAKPAFDDFRKAIIRATSRKDSEYVCSVLGAPSGKANVLEFLASVAEQKKMLRKQVVACLATLLTVPSWAGTASAHPEVCQRLISLDASFEEVMVKSAPEAVSLVPEPAPAVEIAAPLSEAELETSRLLREGIRMMEAADWSCDSQKEDQAIDAFSSFRQGVGREWISAEQQRRLQEEDKATGAPLEEGASPSEAAQTWTPVVSPLLERHAADAKNVLRFLGAVHGKKKMQRSQSRHVLRTLLKYSPSFAEAAESDETVMSIVNPATASDATPMGGSGSASSTDLTLAPPSVLLEGNLKPSPHNLLCSDLATSSEFEISFDLTIHSVHHDWNNVVRFTTTNNNAGEDGDRMPWIGLHPNSTVLRVAMGRPHDHGSEGDSPEGLPLDQTMQVQVILAGTILSVYIDQTLCFSVPGYIKKYPARTGVNVYVSDEQHAPADVTIANLIYAPRTGTEPLDEEAQEAEEIAQQIFDLPAAPWKGEGQDKSISYGRRIYGDKPLYLKRFAENYSLLGRQVFDQKIEAPPGHILNSVMVICHWKDGTNGTCEVSGWEKGGTKSARVKIQGLAMRGVCWSINIYAIKEQEPQSLSKDRET